MPKAKCMRAVCPKDEKTWLDYAHALVDTERGFCGHVWYCANCDMYWPDHMVLYKEDKKDDDV